MALHLPIGPLKTRSELEPVPRYEPSTYKPIADDITTAPSGPVSLANEGYVGCLVKDGNGGEEF